MILRGDARRIPLADGSVDLILFSPPFWALRSYRDGGRHFAGQIGSEGHPRLWLEAMWGVMAECWRLLKPSGSVVVEIGDKRAGSGGHNAAFGRAKSKMLLPHRFAIGCEDGLADPEGIGWIVRQDNVWHKLNGLPESVDDRTRDSHSYIFHLAKQGDYFSATDEIREAHSENSRPRRKDGMDTPKDARGLAAGVRNGYMPANATNPLGRLPGSVWTMATEPLSTPDYFAILPEGGDVALWDSRPKSAKAAGGLFDGTPEPELPWQEPMRWLAGEVMRRHAEGLPQPTVVEIDHFAAFPTELARRAVLGWSPAAVCTACGEGRFPVVDKRQEVNRTRNSAKAHKQDLGGARNNGFNAQGYPVTTSSSAIVGYACACTPRAARPSRGDNNPFSRDGSRARSSMDGGEARWAAQAAEAGIGRFEYDLEGWAAPPTRPAVVLDIFSGTGTTALVARSLGRLGVGMDMSADYCRLGRWRVYESGQGAKVVRRTNRERQEAMEL